MVRQENLTEFQEFRFIWLDINFNDAFTGDLFQSTLWRKFRRVLSYWKESSSLNRRDLGCAKCLFWNTADPQSKWFYGCIVTKSEICIFQSKLTKNWLTCLSQIQTTFPVYTWKLQYSNIKTPDPPCEWLIYFQWDIM